MTRTTSIRTVAAVVGLLLGWPASGQPDPGPRPEGDVVSPAEEWAWGRKNREAFEQSHALLGDGPLLDRVREIGRRLVAVSDRPDLEWVFHVRLSGSAPADYQADSYGGGTVAISQALAELLTDSDDALAFALAHEVAHVSHRHHGYPAGIPQYLEDAADKFGALYAVRAGFAFTGAIVALERLAEVRSGVAERDDHRDYPERLGKLRDFRLVLEKSVDSFRKGLEAYAAGELDRAVDMMTAFTKQFPRSVEGRVNLGTFYLARLATREGSPGSLAEPLPLFTGQPLAIRGSVAGAGLLKQARDNFSAALEVAPFHPEARRGLALVELRTGDSDGAAQLVSFREAPETPEQQLILGNARYLSGQPQRAIPRYQRALELRPDWAAAIWNLALACELARRDADAARQWRRLADDPRYGPEARRRLAQLESRSAGGGDR